MCKNFTISPSQGYRLFQERDDAPVTLYHAHDGNKKLPLNEWLTAYQGIVYNPGKRTVGGKPFRAGFHVFPSLSDLVKYSRTMDGRYLVVRVWVEGLHNKPRSRSTVMLAKHMMVTESAWAMRTYLKDEVLQHDRSRNP